MMEEVLEKAIGKKVDQLFLIVWPPYGEIERSQLDVSMGYVFEDSPNELFVISTDKNDLTTPIIEIRSIPTTHYSWEDFNKRISNWMNCEEEMDFGTEYYNVTKAEIFGEIIAKDIKSIQLLELAKNEPIGIKILFENDYVLSTPIIDGNTVETTHFNKFNNIKNITQLGSITYKDI